jgi:hypothetical protein
MAQVLMPFAGDVGPQVSPELTLDLQYQQNMDQLIAIATRPATAFRFSEPP